MRTLASPVCDSCSANSTLQKRHFSKTLLILLVYLVVLPRTSEFYNTQPLFSVTQTGLLLCHIVESFSEVFILFSCFKVIFDGEEGVDAGGVTKEFFLLLLKELLNPIYGMFTYYQDSNLLWFSDTVSS